MNLQACLKDRKCLDSDFSTPTFQNILRSVASVLSIALISANVVTIPIPIKTLLTNWTLPAMFFNFFFELYSVFLYSVFRNVIVKRGSECSTKVS